MPRAAFYIAVLCLLVAIYVVGRRRTPTPRPSSVANKEAFDDDEKEEAPVQSPVPPPTEATPPPAPTHALVPALTPEPAPKSPPAMDFIGQSLHFMDDIKAIKEDVAFIKERVRKLAPPSYESFYGGRIY